jgi:hypothetical protein
MSWSYSKVGKVPAVAADAAKTLASINCAEPEQTIKSMVANVIEGALAVYPPDVAVKVTASGSQYVPDGNKPNEVINSLSVNIEHLYGFVE